MKKILGLIAFILVLADPAWAGNGGALGPGPELMVIPPHNLAAQGPRNLNFNVSDLNLYDLATNIAQATGQKSQACGLYLVNPWSTGLPYPMVPADVAIINRWQRLLAYYDLEGSWGPRTHVFKNPDGSMRHTVAVSDIELQVATPYQGVIARIEQNPLGVPSDWLFRIGNYDVTQQQFAAFVERNYIENIAGQLCRYAR